MNRTVSVIVPVFNEEQNIHPLVTRIHTALSKNNIQYELIFVDDNSTDTTLHEIQKLKSLYPIRILNKLGNKGKAGSIIEGASVATYDCIAMIDADLQYPPEAIPRMLEKLSKTVGVVIANRAETHISLLRKTASRTFRLLFGKLLHGFSEDVQSGLKVFKKEIIERIDISPSPWTFDLEFLIKARDAGYKIESEDIIFEKRFSGKAKVNILSATFEIAINAVTVKFLESTIIPFTRLLTKKRGEGFHYKGKEYINYSTLKYNESAIVQLTFSQKIFLVDLLLLLLLALRINWYLTLVTILAFLTTLYFLDLLFNLFVIYKSLTKNPELQISKKEISSLTEKNLPMYTIFCPLYKEWEVVPQFIHAINQLDYPKDKLQALLLLEANDRETIEKVKEFKLPSYVQVVVVPHSMPKTKPKALNYGLKFARGEYVVIYDAEDVPDPDQLKKAIISFEKSPENVICIQAKLNFYNPHDNLLTRFFTAEYSLWFDLLLPGLQAIKAPIPLGGTSNHFKMNALRELRGWDAFNVTEDCDLGIRLSKKGFRTMVVNSSTYEEANGNFPNWINQRSRWIKGYIQTYLVHMRDPKVFIQDTYALRVALFQLMVGGKILSLFINPLMWIITIGYFSFRSLFGTIIDSFFPTPVLYMGVTCLLFGNFLYLYYYMIGCAKRGHNDVIKYAFLVPFYWLLMSLAAIKAVDGMIRNPHYWAKTKHGLHLRPERTESQNTGLVKGKLLPYVYTVLPLLERE